MEQRSWLLARVADDQGDDGSTPSAPVTFVLGTVGIIKGKEITWSSQEPASTFSRIFPLTRDTVQLANGGRAGRCYKSIMHIQIVFQLCYSSS